jgi:Asp-tRNA(Asn)/Glu-tRNA(Gln) amidotransferase A subunit family amidase
LTDGDPATLTATEAAEKIAQGAISAAEYVGACLDRVAALDDKIHAFAHLDRDHALAQARALDERRRNGLPIGPLHGIPVGIKDIFDTADFPTECGSPLLAGRRPHRDATAVTRLRSAGAVILGKTVTTEFAYFHPGPTRNPHDRERTPGGSSSGSAAAVAAGMAPLALGSQTNGSVIRPAAFCGVFAIKPSHGLISRSGVLMLSRKLDHVGVFGRSLADLALVLDALAGYDEPDPDTRPVAAPASRKVLGEKPPLPPQFCFVRTPVWDRTTPDARAAFEDLVGRLGDAIAPVELPASYAEAWDDHRVIMAADMAHRLAAVVERGGDASSAVLRKILDDGRKVPAIRYLAALANVSRYTAGLQEIFDRYDAIVTLAAPGVAPKGLASTGDPAFCTLWTLTGLPALSLPVLTGEGGLPLGVQLVGAPNDDARLLRSARWLLDNIGKKKGAIRRRAAR